MVAGCGLSFVAVCCTKLASSVAVYCCVLLVFVVGRWRCTLLGVGWCVLWFGVVVDLLVGVCSLLLSLIPVCCLLFWCRLVSSLIFAVVSCNCCLILRVAE